MKKIALLLAIFAIGLQSLFAQTKEITGMVTSADDGSTIPGVSVAVKGTTLGTITDLDGKYSLKVPQDAETLIFSFVGMEAQEVPITGDVINVAMEEETVGLSEVVVTALSTGRNTREVVYANQTVKSEDLLSTPNKNALEALRGKAAGVRLSTGSGSVGASTRIVLRGEGTLTGNNNALIVVDGIAIDNSATAAGDGGFETGYADHGNRFNDINPDDIESVTILKGPSATSLYGSRGASGVVLITTKSGASGAKSKMKINYNGSVSMEKAIINLKRQNKFGQGYDNLHFDTGENWSWGPEVDGVVRPWTSAIDSDGDGALESLSRPYSAVPNQIQEFFNIGQTINNSINISGSTDGFTYYASFGNTDQTGILDNTYYKRNNLSFNSSAKLSDKLTSSFKITYANIRQNTAQEGSRAFEGNNAYAMAIQSPITIPFGELRDYQSPFHDINGYWGSYSSVNPYYILNEYGNEATIDNFLGNASLKYEFFEGFDITARFGGNIVNTQVDTWTPVYTPAQQLIWGDDLALVTRDTKHSSLGEYENYMRKVLNLDATILANYSKEINDDFSINASGGYNFFQRETESLTGRTVGGLVVDGVYNLANSVQSPTSEMSRSKYRIYGLLANASIGYKNAAFLELSARNDWSSTLPEENNTFFYGAVGTSIIVTDLFDIESDILNFAKLRGSYGTSGKDAGLYLLNSYYVGNPTMVNLGDYALFFPKDGTPAFTVGNRIGNPGLKPELTTTIEFGADLGLFGDRLSVEYTYYKSSHADQIVTISLPRSTGYTQTVSNIGEMENIGHELSLTLRPLIDVVNGLDFELFGTYSTNDNEVIKITDDIDELAVGGPYRGVSVVAKEGMPFGTYKALAPRTNNQGQTIVDPETGFPLYTEEEEYFDSYQPDFLASFGLNANYKGFGLRVLFDMKSGGQFVSQTKFGTDFNGTAIGTAEYNREPFVFPNSVIDNGDGSFTANTIEITEQDYYTNYDYAASNLLIDADYLKLRELELSYKIPKKLLSGTFVSSATVALFGKNLKMWLADNNKFADPEVGGPGLTGNAQGIETTQVPSSRSMGVSVKVSF